MKPYLEKILLWYINLLREHFNRSEDLFRDEQKEELYHKGEYGRYREDAVRDFIQFVIPGKFSVGEGFLVNSSTYDKSISTQCDVVIFDKNTPMFKDSHIRFFPVETTAAVGEVKSTLDTSDLIEALIKLAKIKRMRSLERQTQSIIFRNKDLENQFSRYQFFIDNLLSIDNYPDIDNDPKAILPESQLDFLIELYIYKPLQIWDMEKKSLRFKIHKLRKHVDQKEMIRLLKELEELINERNKYKYDPYRNHHDHIMSFIICKKIDVVDKEVLLKKIEQAYIDEGIDVIHRHNMILSIEDGLSLYYDPYSTPLSFKQQNWAYPNLGTDKLEQRFIPIQEKDKEYHFKQFAHHLYNGIAEVTIIHPETAEYFKWDIEQESDVVNFDSRGMKPIKRRSKIIRNPKNINPKRFNSVRSKRRYGRSPFTR